MGQSCSLRLQACKIGNVVLTMPFSEWFVTALPIFDVGSKFDDYSHSEDIKDIKRKNRGVLGVDTG